MKTKFWAATTSVPSKVQNTQDHQTICAVKSHSRALATFQISYPIYIAWNFYRLKRFTGYVSACLGSCLRTKTKICSG